MSVLIIEGDDALRQALWEALRSAYLCVSAAAAEEGLKWIARHKFDVVVASADLPGAAGPDLVRRVYELHPEVQVIVTAEAPPEVSGGWEGFGVFAYLLKPVGAAEVERQVSLADAHCRGERNQ